MLSKLWKAILFVGIALVFTGAFLWSSLKEGLGDFTRVLYFHVPVAWITVVFFFMAAYYSYRYLRTKDILFDAYAKISNELGILFAIMATITGSIWAKVIWHSFWNWDPRETSIFILLLIYGAYFSLRSAIEQEDRRARLAAVYSLLAFVTVPFFIFIVPRIYFSLHPDPVINPQGKINLDVKQRIIFFSSLFFQTILFLWIFIVRKTQVKLQMYLREYKETKLLEEK
ncbi:MAG: cytochrome c biogenesis protein CcsA [Calditrichaeota bacterium]|nr:cytochrome c biogenesis protein CcsA [Calditrichota bacterium]